MNQDTLVSIWSKIYHMFLPAITYAVLGTTGVIQYLRSEIIDAKSIGLCSNCKK